jgi:hypothetical protein
VWPVKNYLAPLFAIAVIVEGGCWRSDVSRIVRAKANGNELAKALEEFRVSHGHYPVSLDQLVPEVLQAEELNGLAITPTRIQYSLQNKSSYELFFKVNGEMCERQTESPQWDCTRY